MPIIVDEEAVKTTYETVEHLSKELDEVGCMGAVDEFAKFLADVKRALINPGGQTAATLLRALARFDAVYGAIPDPEAGK